MGKIILNNIEYGTGTPNSSNIDTTNLVEKDSIVTTLDDTVTDEQIPSAKAVHTAIQNLSDGVPADVYSKTEVDNLLTNKADTDDIIDSYTKNEVDDLLDAKADSSSLIDAYSKTEVDNLLDSKADSSSIVDAYSKDETNDLLDAKVNVADLVDAYSKTEVDGLLDDKANVDDIVDAYTKEEVDNLLDAKADSTDIVDAYTKTEVDGLLADKADSSALEQLEGALTGYSTLEYLEEAKTDLEEEFHTAMGKKMDVVTSYLNSPSGDLLDTTVAPLVLCALSATNNAGLHKIMNDSFAYVITNFYSSMSSTSNRFQIAVGYGKDKMAFRRYSSGWSAWTEITTTTKLQSEINSFKNDVSTTYYTKTIMDDKFNRFKDDVAMTYATQSEVNEVEMDIGNNIKPEIAINKTNITNLTNKLTDYPTLEYLEEVKTDLADTINSSMDDVENKINDCASKNMPTFSSTRDNVGGGEISLSPPKDATSSIKNNIRIDVYNNKLRFFEDGNGYKGAYLDISNSGSVDTCQIVTNNMLQAVIPTTLPASDVYDWAKEATKPTYTASEVGALASNGTAVNASKVSNPLTISLNGTSQGAYNGSAVKNINITATSVGALPNVGAGGVNELGQYLDLHKGGSTADYDARISVDASNQIILSDKYGSLITNYEINNLKNTVVSGKTSVANAINGKLGTTLSNQTSFADMAYYINTIPSMGSVNKLPTNYNVVRGSFPFVKYVLYENSLTLGQTVTIDGGLIMFVEENTQEVLHITPINAPIKVYKWDGKLPITVDAGKTFTTSYCSCFIFNPNRTQLSCVRNGFFPNEEVNPAIYINIS